MFPTSAAEKQPVVDAASAEESVALVRRAKPRRYHVDEIGTDPLVPGSASRRCGVGRRRTDGSFIIDPAAWEASS
jgi:hypothetical protein